MKLKHSPRLGFLVSHGTDTMSWGLSTIRYMLKNLPANVAITGSQVPGSYKFSTSDVYPNIENSIKLLTQLSGPEIFVVFNNGKAAFRDDLWKIDKWSPDAFRGEELVRIALDEIIVRGRAFPLNLQRKLDKLFLLRTGGTIESEKDENGVLKPTANLITTFIEERLEHLYDEFISISLMQKDSSDLIFNSWKKIANTIAEECSKVGFTTYVDDKFNTNIAIVSLSPFLSEEDYFRLFKYVDAVIVTAYGSGTVNCEIDSDHSILPAIKKAQEEGKIVVISSQTPLGTQDFVYKNAWEPLLLGAIPAGDFSIAHSQVKLAYLLGHKELIEKYAQKLSLPEDVLLKIAFLSGIDFRSYASRKRFEESLGFRIPLIDPFFNLPFELALERIVYFLDRKDLQQITISNLEDLEEAYNKYFTDFNFRNKWAVILKPDTVIGANNWGELVDAAKNLSTITKELLDWNVVTIELSQIDYKELEKKIAELTSGETIGEFFRSFRYTIVEGGRQSLYSSKSFRDVSDKLFTKEDYIELITSLMISRNKTGSNPGLFLCLGHQGIIETLRITLIDIISKKDDFGEIMTPINEDAAAALDQILTEIDEIGDDIKVLDSQQKTIAKGYKDDHFAVKQNEQPEMGLKRLIKFEPSSSDTLPEELINCYKKLAKHHTGMLEDLLNLEAIDIIMLHNDEVTEEAILFLSWAYNKIATVVKKYYHNFYLKEPLRFFTKLPIGLEITGSTQYEMLTDLVEEEQKEPLTEIAGLAIYYANYKTNTVKRDYSLQFHPELLDEIKILQKRDFESKTLLDLTDGLKLLMSCLQAGFIESDLHLESYNNNSDKEEKEEKEG
jgi:L-asparaginase/Glu-tRNA(Gln) amidotransferase subunit D